MIILKVTKKQGLILSLEDTFFGKPQRGCQTDPSPNPPSRFWVNTIKLNSNFQIAFSRWWPPLSCRMKWRTVNTNIFSRLLDKMQ